MKHRTMIRLLAVALTLVMAGSMLAVPASAVSSNAKTAQTPRTTQQEGGMGLDLKAAVGALGVGDVVYFYWNPTAWKKVSNAAQLALGDVASDALLLLGDVAAEAKQTLAGAVADAKEEWERRADRAGAEATEDDALTAQDTQTTKTGGQGSAAQTTPKASEEDTGEAAQVIVKLGGTSAA